MGVEIERKFIVNKSLWLIDKPAQGVKITQGYLARGINNCVRVRVKESKGLITIKGNTENITRKEYEYEVPLVDAMELLETFCPRRIEKIRYLFDYKGSSWEIDEFISPNPDLILAEIELTSENEPFNSPPWIEKEVSHLPEYYNINMI